LPCSHLRDFASRRKPIAALARVVVGGLVAATLGAGAEAHADDHIESTTTWFQEKRAGGLGGLTVIHPQLDIGIDAGETMTLGLGYDADVVSGATSKSTPSTPSPARPRSTTSATTATCRSVSTAAVRT